MATRTAWIDGETPRAARVRAAARKRRRTSGRACLLTLALLAGAVPATAAQANATPHAGPVAVPLIGTPQLSLPVGPARPLTGSAALSVLNQQRRLNGIPPLTLDRAPFASHWCPNEDQGPFEGETARVLSPLTEWAPALTPWDQAPLHQLALYDPRLTAAGAVDVAGKACIGLGVPRPAPAQPALYAFVADGGRADVPPVETVPGEIPYAPQQLVGIPVGQATGPQLIFYAEGFPGELPSGASAGTAMRVRSFSLAPVGAAPLRGVQLVDRSRAAPDQDPSLYNDAVVMIPPVLDQNASYTATVTWAGPTGLARTQTVRFRTGIEPMLAAATSALTVSVSSHNPAPLYAALAPDGQPELLNGEVPLGVGVSAQIRASTSYRLCLYQPPAGNYVAAEMCVQLTPSGPNPAIQLKLTRT